MTAFQLPWPEPELPKYKAGKFGRWSSEATPRLAHTAGYFIPHKLQPPGWMFKHNDTIWMSLTRMEIESHMPHIAAAHGHTVIAGLGMGFVLYNVLKKPEVTKVTLLEKDREVVGLMNKVTRWHSWPGAKQKLKLVVGDATAYKTDESVDFLYADIWSKLGAEEALGLTQAIQAGVNAKLVGFWGQEFDLLDYLRKRETSVLDVTRTIYRSFARDAGLPLIEQDSRYYPRLAVAAVTLQIAAGTKDPAESNYLAFIVAKMLQDPNKLVDRLVQAHHRKTIRP